MARRIAAQACSSYESISKKTVVAMFDTGTVTRKWLDSLEDFQWQITSFDSKTRVVCCDLANTSGLFHFSLTLPETIQPENGLGRSPFLQEKRGKNNDLWS